MYHEHFETLESTQNFLKDNIEKLRAANDDILITTNLQTKGIGRTGNTWLSTADSLTFSFTLKPNDCLSLSTIEIGILISHFFQKRFQVPFLLKWPNDLMNEKGNKIGGIISYYHNADTIIVGVGINLGPIYEHNEYFRHGIDYVKLDEAVEKKFLAREIFNYVQSNRIKNPIDIAEQFNQLCAHADSTVEIDDEQKKFIGKWKGISSSGAAIVEIFNQDHQFISGSLTITP